MLEFFIGNIQETSLENTAGTVLNRKAIENIVTEIIRTGNISINFIDILINENESDKGHLVKASTFRNELKEYIEGID